MLPRAFSTASARSLAAAGHPVVDVAGLLPGASVARRGDAVAAVSAALLRAGPGYFYASGVEEVLGSADDVARVYQLSKLAHGLPVHIKKTFASAGGSGTPGCSYSGMDAGQPEPAYDPAQKAAVRGWDYSRFRRDEEPNETRYPELPDGFNFQKEIDDLYERQNGVGSAVLGGIAEALGLDPSALAEPFAAGDMGTIRLLHYPGESRAHASGGLPEGVDADDVGISPHTDFEAFTLMHQDSPGLQFLLRDTSNTWIDAPVSSSEYVVIVGDILERYTNGVLQATPHRVLRTRHARQSIIRFNAVAPDVVVEPLPQFVTRERPRAYTAVTMRRHMETTLDNLAKGLGSWDPVTNSSLTARYIYD